MNPSATSCRLIPPHVVDAKFNVSRRCERAKYPYHVDLVAKLPKRQYHSFLCGLGWMLFEERSFDGIDELEHDLEIGEQMIGWMRELT